MAIANGLNMAGTNNILFLRVQDHVENTAIVVQTGQQSFLPPVFTKKPHLY